MSFLLAAFLLGLGPHPEPGLDLCKRPGPLPAQPSPPPPALQEGWDITHYDISLALDPEAQQLHGEIGIEAMARIDDPGPLLLHATDPQIQAIQVGGAAADYSRKGDELWVHAGSPAVGESVDLRVVYTAVGASSGSLGLHWGDPIFSFNEPDGARSWLVVYDVPTDKATLAWHITAPESLTVVANGELLAVSEQSDGTRSWDFDFPWPIPPYLMVLNAGQFAEHTEVEGQVPVSLWSAAEDQAQALEAMGDTSAMIEHFSELFGPYPYSLYGNVLVPMGGAMEHSTKTSFGRDLILYDFYAELVNVHELGHQWWGDYVTCAEWEEIWLNEGFASYTETLWYEHLFGEKGLQEYLAYQREAYLGWRENEGLFPLYDPDYMWGGTVYEKGALVLHMLRFVLGGEAFFEGLRHYAELHAHDVATSLDLQQAMEDIYGAELGWFFDQWVYRAGEPSYQVGLTQTDLGPEGWQVDVHVRQTADDLWTMPVEWTLLLQDGSLQRDLQWVEDEVSVFSSCLSQPASELQFSPAGNLLYGELVYDDGAFAPAAIVCPEPVGDTGDTGGEGDSDPGEQPRDSGDDGQDPGSQPEDDPSAGSCGCGAARALAWPAALLLACWGLLLLRRRPGDGTYHG